MIWILCDIALYLVLLLFVLSMCRAADKADRDADKQFARWQAARFRPELDFTFDFAHQPTEEKHAPVLHERLR